jgi:hypothetical protein
MKSSALRAVPVLLFAFVPPAFAQVTPGWPVRHVGHAYFAGASTALTRSVAGELTGDAQSDVVVLAGNTPALLYGPGWHDAVVDFAGGVNDIDIVAHAGLAGLDALVVAKATGCELWKVDRAVSGNIATANLPWSSTNSALRLRVGDVDVNGMLDVVALEGNQRTLRTIRDASAATPTETSITIGLQIQDFVLVDWDPVPGLEFAVLTANGLRVMKSNGTVLFATSIGRAGDVLTRVRGSSGLDRVALVAKSTGIDTLHVFGQGLAEPPLALGTMATVGLASGDLDGDGDLDLVLSRQSTHELLVLLNASPLSPSFSLLASRTLTLDVGPGSTPAPGNQAVPAIADIDQDGDLDIALPVQSTRSVSVLHNPTLTPAARQIGWQSPTYVYCISAAQGTLGLTLLQPSTSLAGATHIEITGWEEHAPGGLVDDTAVKHRYIPVDWVAGQQVISMHVLEDFDSDDIQIYEIREVALSPATLEKLSAGPPRILAFMTDDLTQAALGAQTILASFVCGIHAAGSDIDAGIVEFADVPDFEALDLLEPKDEALGDYGE